MIGIGHVLQYGIPGSIYIYKWYTIIFSIVSIICTYIGQSEGDAVGLNES